MDSRGLRHWQPDEALRAEARLLDQVASGSRPYACEIWTTEQCLVAPQRATRKPGFALAVKDLADMGWPVFLRNTGGDVTPQGPGTLNISIAFALPEGKPPTIERVFEVLCAPIFEELAALGHEGRFASIAGAFCDGDYNVTVDNRKVAGTAQRWRRLRSTPGQRAVFAHALLLYDADLVAGIKAVQRLRSACGEIGEIRVDAHQNFTALHLGPHTMLPPNTLASRLRKRFESDLQYLTTSTSAPRRRRCPSQEKSEGECYV